MGIQYVTGDTVQIDLERGDSEDVYVTWLSGSTPVDLTGYTVEMLNSDFDPIDCTVTIPDPESGRVLVHWSAAQTLVENDRYYRLRVTQGIDPTTLLEGRLNLT